MKPPVQILTEAEFMSLVACQQGTAKPSEPGTEQVVTPTVVPTVSLVPSEASATGATETITTLAALLTVENGHERILRRMLV